MSADRQIARAAVTVMGAFVISNVVGLSKWVLVSRTFGTSAQMDAFNAANRLPEILFTLMAGGALAWLAERDYSVRPSGAEDTLDPDE